MVFDQLSDDTVDKVFARGILLHGEIPTRQSFQSDIARESGPTGELGDLEDNPFPASPLRREGERIFLLAFTQGSRWTASGNRWAVLRNPLWGWSVRLRDRKEECQSRSEKHRTFNVLCRNLF